MLAMKDHDGDVDFNVSELEHFYCMYFTDNNYDFFMNIWNLKTYIMTLIFVCQ
jgi:hypothetical protein